MCFKRFFLKRFAILIVPSTVLMFSKNNKVYFKFGEGRTVSWTRLNLRRARSTKGPLGYVSGACVTVISKFELFSNRIQFTKTKVHYFTPGSYKHRHTQLVNNFIVITFPKFVQEMQIKEKNH